jgi:hypothetical protein
MRRGFNAKGTTGILLVILGIILIGNSLLDVVEDAL